MSTRERKQKQKKGEPKSDLLGETILSDKYRYNFAMLPQQEKILQKFMEKCEAKTYAGALNQMILDYDKMLALFNEQNRELSAIRHQISEFQDLKLHLSAIFKHIKDND